MKNKNKIIILVSIILGILVVSIGITYATFNYTRLGSNQQLVVGDIYMHYDETNELTIENAMPSRTYDATKYFEFQVSGKNTYTKKDIWYEIVLSHGDDHATRTERIKDNLLKFTLIEIKDGEETVVVDGVSYEDLTNKRIWVNTIGKNTTTETTITYKLYMWVGMDISIGNTSGVDYDMDTWNNQVYGSIKVNVKGDFEEKSIGSEQETGAEYIISTVNTGGLVAIGTNGDLYNTSARSGEIREYRYSGPSVNNYIIFNNDGDSTTEVNELWRIIGVFQNSEGKWNLKLMRDTILTADEIPNTYTINGASFTIEYNPGQALWSKSLIETTNGWTKIGLQYFLNTERDDNGVSGYYSTFTENAKKLIDTNYTYYLGNIIFGSKGDSDTAISSYQSERNSLNFWNGNQATWNGAVGLLYPSDYGYSTSNSYWNTKLNDYGTAASSLSWMQQTANHSGTEWFLSLTSSGPDYVSYWSTDGDVSISITNNNSYGVRAVLNLKSVAMIDNNHEGSKNDPYVVIEQ